MPSGLAIGAGLAQGFDNASKNFLASMNAVQEMKMKREKFDIDKKVSDLQMKKLGLELDPETHAQAKKLNDMKIKSMQTIMDLNEEKINQIHNKTTTEFNNFKTGLEFMKTLSPDIAKRFGMDAKGGMKIIPEARQPVAKQSAARRPADYAAYLKSITKPFTGGPLKGYEDDFEKAQKAYDASMFGEPEMPTAAAGTESDGGGGEDDADSRNRIIAELEAAGYPTDEDNVNAALGQLNGD